MFFLDYLITMRTYDTCTSFRVAFIGTVNITLIAFGSIQTQSTNNSHSHSHIHYGNAFTFTYTFTLLHDTIRCDTIRVLHLPASELAVRPDWRLRRMTYFAFFATAALARNEPIPPADVPVMATTLPVRSLKWDST
jgi:hypothetical protein